MSFPKKYRDIILSNLEPGKAYQKCISELASDNQETDYRFTETFVYATEIRYALDILKNGKPATLWNFGDLEGDGDSRLFATLDSIKDLNIALVGCGPYPITAILLHRRYPTARITCIDDNVTAYFLSKAVCEKLTIDCVVEFESAIDVDYSPFNVVLVAAMVRGKRALVNKILNDSKAMIALRGNVAITHERLLQLGCDFVTTNAQVF